MDDAPLTQPPIPPVEDETPTVEIEGQLEENDDSGDEDDKEDDQGDGPLTQPPHLLSVHFCYLLRGGEGVRRLGQRIITLIILFVILISRVIVFFGLSPYFHRRSLVLYWWDWGLG